MASLIRLGLICTHRCYLRQLLVNKEKYPRPKTSVEIDLGIDAYIPGTYITDERQKIEIYKRIRQLENMDMYEELEADLLDRFGEYPDEVAHLLTTGRIKMDGDRALLESIRKRDRKVKFVLSKIGTKHTLWSSCLKRYRQPA